MPTQLYLFTLAAAALSLLYIRWGIATLPGESWQILAAVPLSRNDKGEWEGMNITWYGLLTANAYSLALAVYFLMMAAIGVTPLAASVVAAITLLVCVPASSLVARLVEGKRHTFTVGGAFFAGIVTLPGIVWALRFIPGPAANLPIGGTLAALAIAYAFGEGFGRLACISFGCCYGKPLEEASPTLARLFARRAFVFSGETKKISYAHRLAGVKVVPVQGITAVLYAVTGLTALHLFLMGHQIAAFAAAVTVTQVWRPLSELLRADYRGMGTLSGYQIMAAAAVLWGIGLAFLLPAEPLAADLQRGLASLWNPFTILFIQVVWVAIFFHTGRSMVTGSRLSFHVHTERT